MRVVTAVLMGVVAASVVLSGCGPGVAKWKKNIISQESPDLRREGVLELMDQRAGKSDAAVRLFALLAETDSEATVRSAASRALGESKNPTAVAPLGRVLANDSVEQVRIDAAVALNEAHGPEAVRALVGALREDGSEEVRAACGRTLGEYPYPGVVQALIAALLNDDFAITFEAQQSLEKLTGKSFGTSREWQDWLDQAGDPFAAGKAK